MKSIRVLTFLLLVLALPMQNAGADILWSQMELEGGAFIATNVIGNTLFDDFSFSESRQITGLAWHGGSHTDALPAPMVNGFSIRVYGSIYDSGLDRQRPEEDPVYSRYVPIEQITAGESTPGTWYRTYSTDISDNPFHASGNMSYWLSIQADTAGEEDWWWGWHPSSTENLTVALYHYPPDDPYHPINQAPYYSGNYDFAFQLEGSAVPVPAAVWLLGSGLLGMGVFRRFQGRRRL